MGEHIERLTLAVDGAPGTDERELAELTSELRLRLLELEVEDVQPIHSQTLPPGAKPVDVAIIGALAVSLAPKVLGALLSQLQSWIEQRSVRSVELKLGDDSIKLTNGSREQQHLLVQAFLARHSDP